MHARNRQIENQRNTTLHEYFATFLARQGLTELYMEGGEWIMVGPS